MTTDGAALGEPANPPVAAFGRPCRGATRPAHGFGKTPDTTDAGVFLCHGRAAAGRRGSQDDARMSYLRESRRSSFHPIELRSELGDHRALRGHERMFAQRPRANQGSSGRCDHPRGRIVGRQIRSATARSGRGRSWRPARRWESVR